ncbi:hypothetical protein ACFY9S_15555 [Streptomyces sp. NPDC012474]|uniref:hypothetical protein n=1 Tax=Streptomyces sp. NPDC012474 TaxID=3364836 RepID=UPI0036EECE1D
MTVTRSPGSAAALALLVATALVAGCADRAPDASSDRSPAGSAPRPAIHLDEDDGREVVPGGPPVPFRVSVEGRLTRAQAARRVLGLHLGLIPDRLQFREDGAWHDVPLLWTNEQDDDGEFAAVLPLAHRGRARTEFDFRVFTADRERDSTQAGLSALRIAAQLAPKGWTPGPHPVASAPRVRLPVDPTHLTIEAPNLPRAVKGGPPVEWKVRVRNAAGTRTRSGLRIAVTLSPGDVGRPVGHLPWSIGGDGRWTDLTGRTHVETDEFTLTPGRSRTVRIRVALPPGAATNSVGAAAVLSAAVTAPWWPSDPDEPSGISGDPASTNVLAQR